MLYAVNQEINVYTSITVAVYFEVEVLLTKLVKNNVSIDLYVQ